MAITTKFYFVGTVTSAHRLTDIPIFAFTPGKDFKQGWMSNDFQTANGFKNLANLVSGGRMVSIVLPKEIVSEKFNLKQAYSKLIIDGYQLSKEGQYMVGEAVTTVFEDVSVTDINPIIGWKGLPAPHEGQRNYMDRKKLKWWAPTAVTLFVTNGQANVVQ